jgi:hypothetical protein
VRRRVRGVSASTPRRCPAPAVSLTYYVVRPHGHKHNALVTHHRIVTRRTAWLRLFVSLLYWFEVNAVGRFTRSGAVPDRNSDSSDASRVASVALAVSVTLPTAVARHPLLPVGRRRTREY